MTRPHSARPAQPRTPAVAIRLGCAVLLSLALPTVSRAQDAARTVPDQPSANRETHRQHDSLAVHFLRTPKAKRAGTGAARAHNAKGAAATDASAVSAINTTPLPTRARNTKP